jgi:hypothetical protein
MARARAPSAMVMAAWLFAACGSTSAGHSIRATPAPVVTSGGATFTPVPTSTPSSTASSAPPSRRPTPTATPPTRTPTATSTPYVLLIMLENKGYKATLGSCSADPYFCSLAARYLTAVRWSAVSHPSLPNYFAVTSGSVQGCASDNCPAGVGATDLGGQLSAAGIPWAGYIESIPYACDMVAFSGTYTRVHNPFAYYADDSSPCHVNPYPGSAGVVAALNGPRPPDFVWISPNLNDDMHNGSVQQGDAWLRANLAPILASSWFVHNNATVIVTMDENDQQSSPAGGQIPKVVISARASGAGAFASPGTLYGTLRSIEEVFGLRLLGAAQAPGSGDLLRYFG